MFKVRTGIKLPIVNNHQNSLPLLMLDGVQALNFNIAPQKKILRDKLKSVNELKNTKLSASS